MKPPEKTVKELLRMLDQLKLNTMSAELEPTLADGPSKDASASPTCRLNGTSRPLTSSTIPPAARSRVASCACWTWTSLLRGPTS